MVWAGEGCPAGYRGCEADAQPNHIRVARYKHQYYCARRRDVGRTRFDYAPTAPHCTLQATCHVCPTGGWLCTVSVADCHIHTPARARVCAPLHRLHAKGQAWWNCAKFGPGGNPGSLLQPPCSGHSRPQNLFFSNVSQVSIVNLTTRDPPDWNLHLGWCDDVHVTGLYVGVGCGCRLCAAEWLSTLVTWGL